MTFTLSLTSLLHGGCQLDKGFSVIQTPIPKASSVIAGLSIALHLVRNQSRELVSDSYKNIFVNEDLFEMSCLWISGYQHNGRANCVRVLPEYGSNRFLPKCRKVSTRPQGIKFWKSAFVIFLKLEPRIF